MCISCMRIIGWALAPINNRYSLLLNVTNNNYIKWTMKHLYHDYNNSNFSAQFSILNWNRAYNGIDELTGYTRSTHIIGGPNFSFQIISEMQNSKVALFFAPPMGMAFGFESFSYVWQNEIQYICCNHKMCPVILEKAILNAVGCC